VHLAVADNNPCARQERLKFLRDRVNGHHPVVEEEHLPAAVQLALDGVADEALVVLCDNGLDRQAVLRL